MSVLRPFMPGTAMFRVGEAIGSGVEPDTALLLSDHVVILSSKYLHLYPLTRDVTNLAHRSVVCLFVCCTQRSLERRDLRRAEERLSTQHLIGQPYQLHHHHHYAGFRQISQKRR